MGRKRTFDEVSVLHQILTVFWRDGYEATSYGRLEEVTGLSGRSLINAFGDKEKMFQRCLEAYTNQTRRWLNQAMREENSSGIIWFFRQISDAPPNDNRQYGCLVVNSIAYVGTLSAKSRKLLTRFRELLHERFYFALQADEISNAHNRAKYLCTVLWGCASDIRLQGKTACIAATIVELEILLADWRSR